MTSMTDTDKPPAASRPGHGLRIDIGRDSTVVWFDLPGALWHLEVPNVTTPRSTTKVTLSDFGSPRQAEASVTLTWPEYEQVKSLLRAMGDGDASPTAADSLMSIFACVRDGPAFPGSRA